MQEDRGSSAVAPRSLMVVAGEASGDLHGANLIREIEALSPGHRYIGLGGDLMIKEGLDSVAHARDISVVGFTEVIKVLPRAWKIFQKLSKMAVEEKPAAAILIDSPGFNLRFAKKLKALGVPVVYYISPQVWAWRQGRVREIAQVVEKMMVLFPFELDFYRGTGVDAVHVGHPLVDEVPASIERSRSILGAKPPYRIALLPGSRTSEIRALLPTFLAAAARMAEAVEVQVLLVQAPTLSGELLSSYLTAIDLEVEVIKQDRFEAIAGCDLAFCASGTATLEVAMLGTPMVVAYKVGALTYAVARRLVKVEHIALVNLVLAGRVVPELIQHEATPRALARAGLELLESECARMAMADRFLGVRAALGDGGGSVRAAQEVVSVLKRAENGGRP